MRPSDLTWSLAALPALTRATLRVVWYLPRLDLAEAIDRLRDVPPFRLALLRAPRRARGLVNRLSPWLPPRRTGPCLKQSLILLDLWARCGLTPTLHLGVRPGEPPERFGHAWLTTTEGWATPSRGWTSHFEL